MALRFGAPCWVGSAEGKGGVPSSPQRRGWFGVEGPAALGHVASMPLCLRLRRLTEGDRRTGSR